MKWTLAPFVEDIEIGAVFYQLFRYVYIAWLILLIKLQFYHLRLATNYLIQETFFHLPFTTDVWSAVSP